MAILELGHVPTLRMITLSFANSICGISELRIFEVNAFEPPNEVRAPNVRKRTSKPCSNSCAKGILRVYIGRYPVPFLFAFIRQLLNEGVIKPREIGRRGR